MSGSSEEDLAAAWGAALEGEGGAEAAPPADAIDRQSARPDFQILVFPGPLGIPAAAAASVSASPWVETISDGGIASSPWSIGVANEERFEDGTGNSRPAPPHCVRRCSRFLR